MNGIGVEAEFLAGMPLYRGHEVADQPYHTLLPPVEVAAPLTSVLVLLLGGVILRYLVTIAFFRSIHHVYIV